VRATLIVNPHATSTTPLRGDVVARALASELDLTVVQTRYRGYAALFASEAARDGCGLVLTLGSGTVKAAVNGHFTVNAGLGSAPRWSVRSKGCAQTGRRRAPGLYVWTAIRHFYGGTNRRQPALALELNGEAGRQALVPGDRLERHTLDLSGQPARQPGPCGNACGRDGHLATNVTYLTRKTAQAFARDSCH
jgi:hypothetical protein